MEKQLRDVSNIIEAAVTWLNYRFLKISAEKRNCTCFLMNGGKNSNSADAQGER